MSQFEVFDNPVPRARRAFPLVAILQSELADTGRDRIVAPLVLRQRMPDVAGRLTPVVEISGVEHVLLVPRMTAVSSADLKARRGEIAAWRSAIVAAIDYLFLGL